MSHGAIILCGGKSSRMGRDKATLPFGPEIMLQRVVRLISEAVPLKNTIVVAAADQALPQLPEPVLVVRDTRDYRGPLEGLATGLRVLADRTGHAEIHAVFATACDVPLLVPAFVERMFELLGDSDIAVPFDGEHHHPLSAVYRTMVLSHIQKLLAAERMRPRFLFDEVRTRDISVEDMRAVDPQLATLENLNYEQDYFNALTAAGFADDH